MKKYSRKPVSTILLLLMYLAFVQALFWTIDHRTFEGLTIVGHEAGGRVLVVKLDDDLAAGCDGCNKAAAKAILEACTAGYELRVVNWTVDGIIDADMALDLLTGGKY